MADSPSLAGGRWTHLRRGRCAHSSHLLMDMLELRRVALRFWLHPRRLRGRRRGGPGVA